MKNLNLILSLSCILVILYSCQEKDKDLTPQLPTESFLLDDIIVHSVKLTGIEDKGWGELDKPLFDTLSSKNIVVKSSEIGFLIIPDIRVVEDNHSPSARTTLSIVPQFANEIEAYSIIASYPETGKSDNTNWLELMEISPSRYVSYIDLDKTLQLENTSPEDQWLIRLNFKSDSVFNRSFVFEFTLEDGTIISNQIDNVTILEE